MLHFMWLVKRHLYYGHITKCLPRKLKIILADMLTMNFRIVPLSKHFFIQLENFLKVFLFVITINLVRF